MVPKMQKKTYEIKCAAPSMEDLLSTIRGLKSGSGIRKRSMP